MNPRIVLFCGLASLAAVLFVAVTAVWTSEWTFWVAAIGLSVPAGVGIGSWLSWRRLS